MFSFDRIEGSQITPEMIRKGTFYEIYCVYNIAESDSNILVALYSIDPTDIKKAHYVEFLYQEIDAEKPDEKPVFYKKHCVKIDQKWMDEDGVLADSFSNYLPVDPALIEFESSEVVRVIEVE
ncbi:hypothetical protein M2128_001344 [Polynucleobacter sphagniphilus]|uniref:hypothetical protein n=1 Tax=Polynucleobacter sphagniphilus TaxID=1743169 RepID=UPI002475CB05|nr:hypothetical protein [Polynucleobacter sphagniphilus]MDH6302423.1 hypothetical protein [Polynucleobacter sphagniphilus]